jgi:hypothetical protein
MSHVRRRVPRPSSESRRRTLLVPLYCHATCFPLRALLTLCPICPPSERVRHPVRAPAGGIFDIRWSSALGPAASFGRLWCAARESSPLRLRRASKEILAALRAVDRFPRARPGRPLSVCGPRCHLARKPSVFLPSPRAPIVLSLRSFTGELPPATQSAGGGPARPARPSFASRSAGWRAAGALLRPGPRALRAKPAGARLRLRRAGRAEPRDGPPAPRRRQGCRPLFVARPLRGHPAPHPFASLRGRAVGATISALARSVVAAG